MRYSLLILLALSTAHSVAADPPSDPPLTEAQRQHWSFQPVRRPGVPAGIAAHNPVDAFLLARLHEKGLTFSPETDRLTWLRRVTFDLTGLPPTADEQTAFLADHTPRAFETVVDRLLSSPHHGERWAQHWLDVVRYAESNGYEADGERPHAWRYRDYVVRSFNQDKPYDQFLREQVAGDYLEPKSADHLIALGLHRCGPMHMVGGNADQEATRQEVLTEMVNGLSSAVLGVTMGCARCHDHKFDPLSQGDYYRLQAFFSGTQLKDIDLATAAEKAEQAKETAHWQAKIAPLKARVAALDAPYRARLGETKKKALEPQFRDALAVPADKRTPEQKKLAEHATILIKVTWDEVVAALSPEDRALRQDLRRELHALEAHLPPPVPHAWSVTDDAQAKTTYILKRGDVKQKAGSVSTGFPRVLPPGENPKTRADLARWLTRPDHPLTPRVWANRVWQHHFGRGIVGTPNDFGTRGERPTHPELLDWLASELVRSGWSTKHLHRLIVLSSAYRQTASATAGQKVDPDNRLLWRMNRRRLDAETLRDAMLATAGTLNRRLGGRMVRVPLEPEVYDLIFTEDEPDGLWKVTPDEKEHSRRSLYLFAKRNVRQPLLEAFDQPDTLNSCAMRPVSTYAPQALILMNGPVAQAQARALAGRLLRESPTPAGQVRIAYRFALGRDPRAEELNAGVEFLSLQARSLSDRARARQPLAMPSFLPPGVDPAHAAALVDFATVVFNLNEFIYVD